ncbi:ribose 5-phosphate isomerase [Lactobacillus selangorensis]|uniref:ribose-5-phosphate isomerase n=1 Tax=Lactobacillus selangorensis TaxID=81857 RepID=A0A0R2G5Z9_9LACO|nr:ribose-5-phosphate isomerase A [Lactobacillus selangorensis]KRN28767.1 ribose 5-phosphate isomerase [Lactobacillus selangorensis]KRN32823.1 ribose 5-phosphate isomerase [Lactobacillus selangorensis]
MEPIIKTALALIKPHMQIGLGGGHNVANLTAALAKRTDLNLTFYSPSELTRQNCRRLGLAVTALTPDTHIDLAFDGCDSVDTAFHALKSNGGIFLAEKAYAERSQEYILLVPADRRRPALNPAVPLTIEVAPIAAETVLQFIQTQGYQAEVRAGEKVASWARTPAGNLLVDCQADDWFDIGNFNAAVSRQNGVVATSYFANLVTQVLTFAPDGTVKHYRKEGF